MKQQANAKACERATRAACFTTIENYDRSAFSVTDMLEDLSLRTTSNKMYLVFQCVVYNLTIFRLSFNLMQ